MKDVKYEVSTLLYMQNNINNKINSIITESILRGREVDYEGLKDSINYVMDEQITFIERARKNNT